MSIVKEFHVGITNAKVRRTPLQLNKCTPSHITSKLRWTDYIVSPRMTRYDSTGGNDLDKSSDMALDLEPAHGNAATFLARGRAITSLDSIGDGALPPVLDNDVLLFDGNFVAGSENVFAFRAVQKRKVGPVHEHGTSHDHQIELSVQLIWRLISADRVTYGRSMQRFQPRVAVVSEHATSRHPISSLIQWYKTPICKTLTQAGPRKLVSVWTSQPTVPGGLDLERPGGAASPRTSDRVPPMAAIVEGCVLKSLSKSSRPICESWSVPGRDHHDHYSFVAHDIEITILPGCLRELRKTLSPPFPLISKSSTSSHNHNLGYYLIGKQEASIQYGPKPGLAYESFQRPF
ncbi:hypothetical protein DFH29DRAFT_1034930 [Suillus ampliporus]|nr:hypothetical protein DFH29DRAFT_1034930 [Suillus ampliporus]